MVIASSSHYWTIAFGNQKGQVTSNQEKMMTMRKLAENIVWLAKKLHYEDDLPLRKKTALLASVFRMICLSKNSVSQHLIALIDARLFLNQKSKA